MNKVSTGVDHRRVAAAYFLIGLFGGIAAGLLTGMSNVYHSAAIPHGMTRLVIETLSRDVATGLRWGLIFGPWLAIYGSVSTAVGGNARRGFAAMLVVSVMWIATALVILYFLMRDFDKRLPLPYVDYITPGVLIQRFVWPVISFAVTTKPVAVFFSFTMGSSVPAVIGWGIFALVRKWIPENPFAWLPILQPGRRTAIIAAAVFAVVLGIVFAPTALGRPTGKPNVLFISVDTLRADGLHCYGNQRPTSPAIDALAARGVRYENYYSSAPWTLPGHVSMLTGMVPDVHGTYQLNRRIPDEAPLLAEAFKNEGYDTMAMVSNFLVGPPYGFARGIDRFLLRHEVEGGQVTRGAIQLLETAHEPWFAFVHYFDPHLPYFPSDAAKKDLGIKGPRARRALKTMTHLLYRFIDTYLPYDAEMKDMVRLLYDGEVRDADRAIGHLLDYVQSRFGLENTIVVVTSDHGEEFYEHGWQGHSVSLHDESLHVPLVFAGPGVPAGEVRNEIEAMPMLAPMVMDLAGVPDPLHRDWRAIAAADEAYGHSNAFGNYRYSYRHAGHSFLTAVDFTFGTYHITNPPAFYDNRAEIENLIEQQPERAEQWQQDMEHYVGRQIKQFGTMRSEEIELDSDRLQRLKELGYMN